VRSHAAATTSRSRCIDQLCLIDDVCPERTAATTIGELRGREHEHIALNSQHRRRDLLRASPARGDVGVRSDLDVLVIRETTLRGPIELVTEPTDEARMVVVELRATLAAEYPYPNDATALRSRRSFNRASVSFSRALRVAPSVAVALHSMTGSPDSSAYTFATRLAEAAWPMCFWRMSKP
jgi:hypothetical protein